MSAQTHINDATREELARRYLKKAAMLRDHKTTLALTSGGTESLAAADVAWRWGPDYGIEIDAVAHVNTGAGMTVTRDVVQEFCADRGLRYIEGLNKNPDEMLAPRVLTNGWPSQSKGSREDQTGHWREWVMRKDRVFDGLYGGFEKPQLWVSGIRYLESDQRAAISGESPVYIPNRRPNRTWLNPCHAWTDDEIEAHIEEYDIPKSPAYDFVGHSGDCLGCSFDDPTVLRDIALIEPELAYSMKLLVVWTYQRIVRGDLEVPIHRCVWGWPPELEGNDDTPDDTPREVKAVCDGCRDGCYANLDSFWGDA